MVRGLFVTGTDTNVGKTVVSAALMRRCRGDVSLRYWKPIQTGIEQDDDSAEVARLAECQIGEILNAGVRLRRPLSPHLAARLAGHTIDVTSLVDRFTAEQAAGPLSRFIVEGAGGVLVPITETDLMVDLMSRLALPAVVVARSTLGTINHTLLTLDAVRHRAIAVAGVVLVGPPNPENRAAIEQYGRVTVLGEMPRFDSLTPDALAAWSVAELDRDGRLAELLK